MILSNSQSLWNNGGNTTLGKVTNMGPEKLKITLDYVEQLFCWNRLGTEGNYQSKLPKQRSSSFRLQGKRAYILPTQRFLLLQLRTALTFSNSLSTGFFPSAYQHILSCVFQIDYLFEPMISPVTFSTVCLNQAFLFFFTSHSLWTLECLDGRPYHSSDWAFLKASSFIFPGNPCVSFLDFLAILSATCFLKCSVPQVFMLLPSWSPGVVHSISQVFSVGSTFSAYLNIKWGRVLLSVFAFIHAISGWFPLSPKLQLMMFSKSLHFRLLLYNGLLNRGLSDITWLKLTPFHSPHVPSSSFLYLHEWFFIHPINCTKPEASSWMIIVLVFFETGTMLNLYMKILFKSHNTLIMRFMLLFVDIKWSFDHPLLFFLCVSLFSIYVSA